MVTSTENEIAEISTRAGRLTDAEAAWRLYQAHLNWINVWYEPDDVVQRRASYEFFQSLFRHWPSAVAEIDGVIVGFALSQIRQVSLLEVMNVYVDDPYRGQRIGTQLLQLVEEQATNEGFRTLMATASARYYPGKQLPESLFRRAGYEVNYLDPDTHFYLKKLAVELGDVPTAQLRHITLHSSQEEGNGTIDLTDSPRRSRRSSSPDQSSSV